MENASCGKSDPHTISQLCANIMVPSGDLGVKKGDGPVMRVEG